MRHQSVKGKMLTTAVERSSGDGDEEVIHSTKYRRTQILDCIAHAVLEILTLPVGHRVT